MKENAIYLNHVLSSKTPLYGDSGSVDIVKSRQTADGDTANCSDVSFAAHSGTHIDAPFHFDGEGKGLADYPADFWICRKPWLIEKISRPDELFYLQIWEKTLQEIPEDTDCLIIKTGFESFRNPKDLDIDKTYIFNNPGFAPDFGIWLRQNRRLKMIGFDFISLTGYQNRPIGRKAHQAFLRIQPDGFNEPLKGDPILIIEDMKLSGLHGCPSKITVAPLLYDSADGAPVTVLAEY